MARPIHKLTVLTISRARRDGRYGDGGGLYLQVDGGSKSWLFRYKRGEQTHYMGFGPVDMVSIDEARARALECRKLLHAGLNPVAAREAERAKRQLEAARTLTFDACVDAYLKAHKAGWRNPKHRQQWENTLKTYASPMFGGLPVRAIDVALVMRVIEPIWSTKPETANRLRGRIELVLGWARSTATAAARTRRGGAATSTICFPRAARSARSNITPHCPTSSCRPSCVICATLRHRRAGTGIRDPDRDPNQRDAERGMVEFDLDNKLWIIPAERMKGGREHRVPLCDRAVAIVAEMRTVRCSDYVFPGAKRGKPLSNMAMLTTLRRMERGDLTAHGFRATFKTWATEQNPLPARGDRGGAGARHRRQDRGGVPARRSAREAAQADGRMGGVLRQPRHDRQRGRAAMTARKTTPHLKRGPKPKPKPPKRGQGPPRSAAARPS